MQRERQQIGVTDASANASRASSNRRGVFMVTGSRSLDRSRKQQQAMLGAFGLHVLKHSVSPSEPTTGLREIPFEKQGERHPEQAPRGSPRIAGCDVSTVGALQRLATLTSMTEEICRRCQQLEILPRQRTRRVGVGKRLEGVGPCEPMPSLTAPHELRILTHSAARLPNRRESRPNVPRILRMFPGQHRSPLGSDVAHRHPTAGGKRARTEYDAYQTTGR
jgi:hypothetical protein